MKPMSSDKGDSCVRSSEWAWVEVLVQKPTQCRPKGEPHQSRGYASLEAYQHAWAVLHHGSWEAFVGKMSLSCCIARKEPEQRERSTMCELQVVQAQAMIIYAPVTPVRLGICRLLSKRRGTQLDTSALSMFLSFSLRRVTSHLIKSRAGWISSLKPLPYSNRV